jgi:hypothetical protein
MTTIETAAKPAPMTAARVDLFMFEPLKGSPSYLGKKLPDGRFQIQAKQGIL